jgi:DHA2 family multidrug resistance protein
MLYGTTAMLPLFLQTLLGYPALQSGLAVSPRGFGALAASVIAGRLVGRIDNRVLMTAGFVLLATSGLVYSHMTLEVAQSNVVWTSVLNGFATPLIFVPLTTITMGTLRNEQMGNATGIFNLMRNTGASIGIAAMTTSLARGAQAHQAVLVTHLTPDNPLYRQWLETARAGIADRLGSVTAGPAALGMLYQTLVRQATLLAFLDNFRMITGLAICCLPLVFLFRRVRTRPAAVVH